jgi:hypothetical protein
MKISSRICSIIFSITLIVLAVGCRKDKSQMPCNNDSPCPGDCLQDIDIASLTFGYVPDKYGVHYFDPFYNPLNNDQFVYFKADSDSVGGFMNVFDQTTGIVTEVLSSATFTEGMYRPIWSRSNWIVFGSITQNIWKIRPDGSNLTQLTFSGNLRNPEVNYSGDTIVAFANTIGAVRFDISGIIVDTLVLGPLNSWNSLNQIAAPYATVPFTEGIGIYDVNTMSIGQLVTWSFSGSQDDVVDIKWHPSNEDIYHSQWSNGIYKVNMNEGIVDLVKVGCLEHYYPTISISNGGDKILACKLMVDSITPSDELAISQFIVTMDINGCNEQKVIIP